MSQPNVHSDDYYKVLGLERSATEDQIKKAYRKLAIIWHPDKNPNNLKEAEEVFKKIGEAYAVLSDKDKKAVYDRYGKEGLTHGAGGSTGGFSGFDADHFSFMDANDIFKKFFGGRDPFANFFDDDDDFRSFGGFGGFPSGFGGPKKQQSSKVKRGGDPFMDDFFGKPFGGGFPSGFGSGFGGMGGFQDFGNMNGFDDFGGGMQGFSSFQSSSFGGGPGSTSVKTQTYMENGKKVTRTEKTTVDAQGRKKTEVKEEITDGQGRRQVNQYQLTDGQPSGGSQQAIGNSSGSKTVKKKGSMKK